MRGYVSTLATAEASGTALATFTTAASILNGAASQALCTLPPDYMLIGKQLRIRATIAFGNVITAQPTFTINVNFGATVVFTTGALTTSTTAHTALPCEVEINLTCRAVNSSTANLMGTAVVTGRPFLLTGSATADLATLGVATLTAPATTPAVGNNFNSGASQQVDLQVACGTSNAANTAQLIQYTLQDLCTI